MIVVALGAIAAVECIPVTTMTWMLASAKCKQINIAKSLKHAAELCWVEEQVGSRNHPSITLDGARNARGGVLQEPVSQYYNLTPLHDDVRLLAAGWLRNSGGHSRSTSSTTCNPELCWILLVMSSVILGRMLTTTGLQAWLRSAKCEASGRPSFPRVETMSSQSCRLEAYCRPSINMGTCSLLWYHCAKPKPKN